MIDGLIIQPLKVFADEKGKVLSMLRRDDANFKEFGEIYFSIVNPGAIKAWRKHSKMTQYFAVPIGAIELVLYDSREDSKTYKETQIIKMGEDNYCLIKIPPLVWYGFKGTSQEIALIANCADLPHDPDEIQRIEASDKKIPYNWKNNE
jgi:dTDP-4-dehydrorhamnose 3,5-epimerase